MQIGEQKIEVISSKEFIDVEYQIHNPSVVPFTHLFLFSNFSKAEILNFK